MKKTLNFTQIIKRISILALLLSLFIQIVSVIFMVSDIEICEIDEIHEISGFVFFGLIAAHLIVFRKGLVNILTSNK